MKRKCIALEDENAQYIERLVEERKSKNFSKAVNETIEQRRQNDQYDSCQNKF